MVINLVDKQPNHAVPHLYRNPEKTYGATENMV